jgi:hypothetical protein
MASVKFLNYNSSALYKLLIKTASSASKVGSSGRMMIENLVVGETIQFFIYRPMGFGDVLPGEILNEGTTICT